MNRRREFTFEHPPTKGVVTIKARTEKKAWKKLRRIIEYHFAGPFNLTYNATQRRRIKPWHRSAYPIPTRRGQMNRRRFKEMIKGVKNLRDWRPVLLADKWEAPHG